MATAQDGIQLFLHSAQRVDPAFELNDHNEPHVRLICQRVEGMPLGIELAAAWLRALSLEEITAELSQALDLLETKTHSLRALFDRSWDHLSTAQREAFMRLSVFRGGCTRPAAEAVTGANLRLLSALVDKSLLRHTAEGRYDMHELLRQYAEEQLEAAGQADHARRAHMNYYAHLLQQREASLKGAQQVEAIHVIESDFDNIRAAWHMAVHVADFAALNAMLHALSLYTDVRCRWQESDRLFQMAIGSGRIPADHPVMGRILARQTLGKYQMGFLDEARDLVQQALPIARASGDQAEMAYCLGRLAQARVDPDQKSG